MSEAQDFKYIGQRTIRPDGHDKVTGRANYAADLALPEMIWGKILRSPCFHKNSDVVEQLQDELLDSLQLTAKGSQWLSLWTIGVLSNSISSSSRLLDW